MKHLSLADEVGKRNPFEDPKAEAYLNVVRTASVLAAPLAGLFRRHGLSDASHNVLRILRGVAERGDGDGIAGREIADSMVSRVPDISRLVERLLQAGLVDRAPHPADRRKTLVTITQKGLACLAELDGPVSELHAAQFSALSGSELAELSRLLTLARRTAE
ncbi:MAG: MarR family winged helix-turn-helix transcriptional regulator [Phycisphaerales bacterium]